MSKNQFVSYVLDLLSPYGHITARAMFGGYGIYKEGLIAGIVVRDELYFKVDAASVKDYEVMGSEAFTYDVNGKTVKMSYWQVPLDIMEDEELLGRWFERSWLISHKSKKK